MSLHKLQEIDYMMALDMAQSDPESYRLVERLIKEHFAMIEHMKNTSLWDVYSYEQKVTQPLEILVYDNTKLKKEVNDLRKELGLGAKYKE